MNKWEGIFENWRRFLFITYQITKTSLGFEKCVRVREILDTKCDPSMQCDPQCDASANFE
jgi:hypothetical protein